MSNRGAGMKIFAFILFVLMYILMIAKPAYRPFYALSVAAIFLLSGILPPDRLMSTINWNVLLMMSGTMIIVYYFIDSHMPSLLADILLKKSRNFMWVTILMSLFAGVISAAMRGNNFPRNGEDIIRYIVHNKIVLEYFLLLFGAGVSQRISGLYKIIQSFRILAVAPEAALAGVDIAEVKIFQYQHLGTPLSGRRARSIRSLLPGS